MSGTRFARPLTKDEYYAQAVTLSDDVSWYNVRDDANRNFPDWEQGYNDYCTETLGYIPVRLHNLTEPNMWGYDGGPACVQQLPALPPDMKQWQISALNDCVPYEYVCVTQATINKIVDTLKQAGLAYQAP